MKKLVIAALFCFCNAAVAAESGAYIGGGLSDDHMTACDKTAATCNTFTYYSGPNLRLLGGYAFGRHFAIEAGYSDFGSYSVQTSTGSVPGKVKISAVHVAAKGAITFGQGWSIFGIAGLSSAQMKYSANPGWVLVGSANQSSGGVILGLGGQYDFDNVAIRLWTTGTTYSDSAYTGIVGGTTLAAIYKF